MIGLVGTRADPVMLHFATHCVRAGIEFAVIDLVELAARGQWQIGWPASELDVVRGDEVVRLSELTGLFVRPIPVPRDPPIPPARWQGLLDALTTWLDATPLEVANRPYTHQTNGCKPVHYAWLGAMGFLVPPSLLSRDPELLRDFLAGGRIVVKPVSGVRARTREVTAERLAGVEGSTGPILVQRFIQGSDVRVHVIGDEVIACRFVTDAIDYRTDSRATKERIEVPGDLSAQLVHATRLQGLDFAGWDFKVDADGSYWCLECNPMPGYSFYDRVCAGAISSALALHLAG